MTKPGLVSVLIVNWNGLHLLPECLAAVRRQTWRRREVIVVDNGSTDGSLAWLRRQRDIRVVALERNLGFTGGNLAGYALARGGQVALLNNDAVPEPGWLAALVRAMAGDPAVGICASRIVRYDRPALLDAAGDGCSGAGSAYKRGEGEPAAGYFRQEYVFGATAAAVLYRRAMLDDIGFLDPHFFLNAEDSDLSFRAQLLGWRCLYVPGARARHHVSASVGRLDGRGLYYMLRNDEWIWVKNMPWPLMLRYAPHKLVREANSFLHCLRTRGHWRIYAAGKLHALAGLPRALRQRRALQPRRRASLGYLQSMLTSNFDRKYMGAALRRWLTFR